MRRHMLPEPIDVEIQFSTYAGSSRGGMIRIEDPSSGILLAELRLTPEQLGNFLIGSMTRAQAEVSTPEQYANIGKEDWNASIAVRSRHVAGETADDALQSIRLLVRTAIAGANLGTAAVSSVSRNNRGQYVITVRGYSDSRGRAVDDALKTAVALETWAGETFDEAGQASWYPRTAEDE